MRKVLAGIVLLAMTSTAAAEVGLSWSDPEDIGSGLYRTVVSAYDTSTKVGSFATSNLVFTAGGGLAFNQGTFLGGPVNVESLANTYNGVLGYSKGLDTWYYDVSASWGSIAPDSTNVSGTSTLTLNNLGTGTSTYWGPDAVVPLLHIVSTEGYIDVTGGISRDGVTYSMSGLKIYVPVPEPGTLALLGGVLGFGALLALLRRRRK